MSIAATQADPFRKAMGAESQMLMPLNDILAESTVKFRVEESLVSFTSCFGTVHLAAKLLARAQSSKRIYSVPEMEHRSSLPGEHRAATGPSRAQSRPSH